MATEGENEVKLKDWWDTSEAQFLTAGFIPGPPNIQGVVVS